MTKDGMTQWADAVYAEQCKQAPAYSPLVEQIKHIFDQHKAQPNNNFIFFLADSIGGISSCAIPEGCWPWATLDLIEHENPGRYNLVLALDLKKDFDSQFPDHWKKTMTKWDALRRSPIIWIPDRTGKIPAEERGKILAGLQKPALTIVK